MRHIFILNPAAGHADSTTRLSEEIAKVFGTDAIVHTTRGAKDATEFVRTYAAAHSHEPLRFYACGGDGTFSEVVLGAMGFSHAAVGVVPIGTGNDFVRNFTDKQNFLSIARQRDGREIAIDVLRCNEYYCVNMLNLGFDCEVVARTQEIKRHVPAGMAYAMSVMLELVRKPCAQLRVTADGVPICDGEKLLCAVANGGFYGGGYHPLPEASMCDGLIDVCLVNNVSRARFLSLIGRYKQGTHIDPSTRDIIQVLRCRQLSIELPAPCPVCIDGELLVMDRCDIELVPAAVRLVVPEGSRLLWGEDADKERTL